MTVSNTLSEKEYRSFPAESFSSLKYILESPEAFLYYKNKPFKGNDSALLGTTVHNYLQGMKHLVAFNTIKRTSKERKEEYAQFEKDFLELAGEDGIIVPQSFEETLTNIMNNYHSNKKAVKIIESCEYEVPYFFRIKGLNLKGKVDGVCTHNGMTEIGMNGNSHPSYLLEIKTSSQATTALDFKEEAKERNYDMQAAMYLEAHRQLHEEKLDHYFVVVNTLAPYKVSIYKSSKEFLMEGERKLHEACDRYNRHIINQEPFEGDIETI